jgi:hypothetical protein
MTAAASRKLRGSTGSFNTAQFTAGTVSFMDTIFTGGVVDLSHTFPRNDSATTLEFLTTSSST